MLMGVSWFPNVRSNAKYGSVEVNECRTERRMPQAIIRWTIASNPCRNRWPLRNGNATSWNITQTFCFRCVKIHQQNARFMLFQPYMCGTY